MNTSVAAGSERPTILASHPEILTPTRANPYRHIRFCVLLCLVGVLGAGCIFSPDKGKKVIPPIVYPKRDTPQSALLFLQLAWENRDSVALKSVYADDYAGSSVDLTDPNPTTLSFVKSDEVNAVGGLAKNQAITLIDMEFYSRDSWFEVHYVGDPSDWVTFQIPNYKIQVRAGQNEGFEVNSITGGIFEFTLKPSGPAAEPWQIVRWVESRG